MYRIMPLIIGYFLGGIQTAILYGHFKGIDIRDYGSGNAGATNTLRVMGKKSALIVFVGDILKAIIAVICVKMLFTDHALIAGLYAGIGAILGHSYPLFFNFRGGKGIAVTVGMLVALDFRILVIAGASFILLAAITKIVSISSILLATTIPIALYGFYRGTPDVLEAVILGCCILGITAFRHKANIKRLIEGTESKLTDPKKEVLKNQDLSVKETK